MIGTPSRILPTRHQCSTNCRRPSRSLSSVILLGAPPKEFYSTLRQGKSPQENIEISEVIKFMSMRLSSSIYKPSFARKQPRNHHGPLYSNVEPLKGSTTFYKVTDA